MRKRIDKLTDAEASQLEAWADRWIEIGLRTGDADRPRFEAAVAECYRFASLAPPLKIVWVASPLVAVLAGPIAASLLHRMTGKNTKSISAVHGAVHDAVGGAVHDAVGGAVHDTVRDAVGGAVHGSVHGSVHGAVGDAVHGAVHDAVHGAVHGAVGDAVHGAVGDAVGGAVRDAVGDAVHGAVHQQWMNYIGGQFWCGGWYYGAAFNSFFREICQLELAGDVWERARNYEATVESACWWWPHTQFVMVSDRPVHIKRELTNPAITRGSGSHRLHSAVGPSVLFRDGFAVWSWHGVRVTEQIIMAPETLTATQIASEKNAQVRQVMVERVGIERVCQMFDAQCIDRLGDYELLVLNLGDGRNRPYLKMVNPSIGVFHIEGVHPDCKTVQQSLNWRANGNVTEHWQPEILT